MYTPCFWRFVANGDATGFSSRNDAQEPATFLHSENLTGLVEKQKAESKKQKAENTAPKHEPLIFADER